MTTPYLAYTAIRDVNLEPLREAVKKWQKLPGKMDEVSTTFGRTVSSPLEQSGWYGETADAAFKKFRNIRNQMAEASGQARKIGTVMSEALTKFEDARDEIRRIDKAVRTKPEQGENYLRVNEKEGVVYLDPPDDMKTSPGLQKAYHETIADYNHRILAAIRSASDADHDLLTALRIDPPGKGFNDDIAGHLGDVDAETKKDLDAALDLAKDKGTDMSEKELTRLNGLLAKNARNPDFAEKFALKMGPQGTLDFWLGMAEPETRRNGAAGSVRVERSKAENARRAGLQDNLGVILGLASQSDSDGMRAWKKDMLELSTERIHAEEAKGRIGGNPGPYNTQVLSNLMRTGKWDTDFLHDYGDKIIKLDKEDALRNHRNDPPSKWISGGLSDAAFLNFGPENDAGEDPLTGFMEALGHNPEASTEFFKDEGNFDYLTSQREWPRDGEVAETGDLKGVKGGVQALSHALASATTGHDYEQPLPDRLPAHTGDQAELMSRIIKGTADIKDDFALQPGMHEYLGRAAAEYTPDLFRAIKDGSGDDTLFPMRGHQAEMTHADATRFLVQLGQNPEANAALYGGQKLYTQHVLEHHLAGDLPAAEKYQAGRENTVEEILRTSGEVAGTMAIGRQEATIGDAVREMKEFDGAILSKRLWANGGFGTVVAGASAMSRFAPNPVAAVTVSSMIIGAEGAWANDFDREYLSFDETIEKADAAGRLYDEMSRRDVQQNEKILEAIAKEHDVDVSLSWAELYSDDGFAQGYSRVNTTAPFLTSHEQVSTLAPRGS
ncbi:hypothetical protein DTL70_14035 [Streptomyces diacarni]|uniref:DUF6571 domain-containing protein n=1 Tax=Streptomyces diacarni TaxID=2800381 RepID=A0A367F1D6_9ACTN|nr:DUF6571 family protein [Streptomyces diacarni]RCG23739.1 hypothetical protein DTL70_14035 [Streptomyces diacarni]